MVGLFKEPAMPLDLDTFLVAVYCIVDELYQTQCAPHKPPRSGPAPHLSDSEVLTLTLLGQWRGDRSERALLRYATAHWRAYFPVLLSQSAFNRRVRDLAGVLTALGPLIAQQVTTLLGPAAYEVLDGLSVPLARRCRGVRHRCFTDEAAIGRGGSDRTWYYGVKLVGAVSAAGVVTGSVLTPANTEEHWGAEALLRWRVDPTAPVPTVAELEPVLGPPHRGPRTGPTGPVTTPLGVGTPASGDYVADRGYRGQAWQRHWHDDLGATVRTAAELPRPAPADPVGWTARRQRSRWLARLRQVAETAFGALVTVFGLPFPKARTAAGVRARIAAKLAAFNLAVLLNYRCDRPTFSFFNPFD
jgi:hypothetical protein